MSLTFFEAAGERAIKTFAQTLIAVLTLSSVPLDVMHTAWQGDLSLAVGATLLSLLTSLAGLTPPVAAVAPADVSAAKHAAPLPEPYSGPGPWPQDGVPLPPVPVPVGDTHGA